VFRRPELLVAASVPVLLLAGVLAWHRDVVCTRSGCGTVTASAWTGSPVWAVVLVAALALGGVWVLLPPTRGEVPLGIAALTGVAGVVSTGIVLVSLHALVFNHAAFFGFDLPVTETFPVLAVHPGPGLLLGLLGLILQAAGGWTSVRHRTALLTPPRRHASAAQPWPTAAPSPESRPVGTPSPANPQAPAAADPWPVRTPSPATPRPAAAADRWPAATPPVADPWPAAMYPAVDRWPAAPSVADPGPPAAPSVAQPGAAHERGWEAVAFGQGAPPPRRHRRRAE
jgi:hypothetical protein